MDIRFYHLTKTPMQRALPQILEKLKETDKRAYLYSALAPQLKELSKAIWGYKPSSFINHGLGTDPQADQQPILLDQEPPSGDPQNQATTLITVSALGEHIKINPAYDQWLYFFDGNNQEEVNKARALWKTLSKEEGSCLTYFQQTEKGWEKK